MIFELEQLAEGIFSGQVVSRIEAKNHSEKAGEIPVLTLKAINCGIIDEEERLEIPYLKEVDKSKICQKDDIIMKMNRPYDSVYIETMNEGYLIPSFCCKISKIRTDIVDPYYLVGFLNSNFAKEYLLASNGASASSLLKISDIKRLPVPLPELEEQRAIGEVFKACCERRIILHNLIEQEMALVQNIILDATREAVENGKK